MQLDFATLLIICLHGLVYGVLIFLVASGLSIVFGMMGVLNLAHASFYMFGAYIGVSVLQLSGNFWLSLVIAPILTAGAGSLSQHFLLKPLRHAGHLFELIITVGLSFVILEIVKWVWGTEPVPVSLPEALSGAVQILGSTYPVYRLFVFFFGLAVLAVLALILYKTSLGMIVRAAITHPAMVSALGTNTPLVFNLVFSMGTGLAGLAGVIAGPILGIYPGMALTVGMDVFVVVVVGGLGSLMGAIFASFIIGELQSFGVFFFPEFSIILIFLLMAVVLSIRPQGLFGEKG
jgi:branched-chain amino acid transport system permease protein